MVMDGSSLFLFRDVFCFDDAKFDDDGFPSSWLQGTYLSDEAGGNGERPIGDRHRKHLSLHAAGLFYHRVLNPT
jgi:hypothetical protein